MVAHAPLYSAFTALGFAAAFAIKRHESRRLGMPRDGAHRWVTVGALLGAIVGAKLGLLLYAPPASWADGSLRLLTGGGKTILGALVGGYLGVELAKHVVGIRHSTGDALALALPIAQAIGRVGCALGGCCYGKPWPAGAAFGLTRHPSAAYEATGLLVLAAILYRLRDRTRAPGQLFRGYMIGFFSLRVGLDAFRGDPRNFSAGLSWPQWFSLAVAIYFSGLALRAHAAARRDA